ncbi:Magnesium transporter NIPA [Vigna unguiculata]|uniref:Probable magnesium transporter n=1 Tax=Vigna unguiculata TaxID=3917 RepID=A0A4D6NRX5_VIGUN|nr:Magnesium transporter NIPA [Vigna unguiculata]
MWESIVLTVVATAGNNIGKILQKKGTVIRAYALNKTWLIGFLMDIFGALLMLRALALAPVSVIQPVSGCGLAILSVFSHFYLKEVMNVVDWVGITFAGFGTIGVGAGGEEQGAAALSIFHIPWLAFVVFILFVEPLIQIMLNGWLRICRRNRREQEMIEYDVVEEIIYGLESGILFGMASVISKMGFLFLEQGFPKLLVPICLIVSVCSSGTGFYYQTRGLKHGRAIIVSTCAAVASILTGVLAGMLALGERLPSAPKARMLLLLGW